MTLGLAGALMASPIAASAAISQPGGSCLDYHVDLNGHPLKIATLCRSWTPNANGTYSGRYVAKSPSNPNVEVYAFEDGQARYIGQGRTGLIGEYANKYDVRLNACFRGICSGYK